MIIEASKADLAQERFFELLKAERRANPKKKWDIDDFNRLKFQAGKEVGDMSVCEPINQVRVANGLEPFV